MPRPRALAFVAALFALLLIGGAVSAEELTVDQIVAKSTEGRSFKNSVQTMTMKIYAKDGRSRVRKITSKMKEGEDGLTRSYVRFVEPEDVEGVQFLSVENPTGEDGMWLYMPAIGQPNQISGSGKSNSFMGSDFSFEDLAVGNSTTEGGHVLVGEETVEVGGASFVSWKIETVPDASLESSYGKIVTWIDKVDFMPRQVEFIDKKGVVLKRMKLEEVVKDGALMIPTLTVMMNLKRGTKTEIIVEEYKVDVPAEELPDTMFTPEFLVSEG